MEERIQTVSSYTMPLMEMVADHTLSMIFVIDNRQRSADFNPPTSIRQ